MLVPVQCPHSTCSACPTRVATGDPLLSPSRPSHQTALLPVHPSCFLMPGTPTACGCAHSDWSPLGLWSPLGSVPCKASRHPTDQTVVPECPASGALSHSPAWVTLPRQVRAARFSAGTKRAHAEQFCPGCRCRCRSQARSRRAQSPIHGRGAISQSRGCLLPPDLRCQRGLPVASRRPRLTGGTPVPGGRRPPPLPATAKGSGALLGREGPRCPGRAAASAPLPGGGGGRRRPAGRRRVVCADHKMSPLPRHQPGCAPAERQPDRRSHREAGALRSGVENSDSSG